MGFEVFTLATPRCGLFCCDFDAEVALRADFGSRRLQLRSCNNALRVGNASPSWFFPGQTGSEISSFE